MNKSKLYPWYFALASLIIYTVFSVIPGLIGIGYSFTDWSAYSKEIHFAGFRNFAKIFSGNSDYLKYIINTLVFTVVTTFFKTGLGLLFAVLSLFIRFSVCTVPRNLKRTTTIITFQRVLCLNCPSYPKKDDHNHHFSKNSLYAVPLSSTEKVTMNYRTCSLLLFR